MRSIILLVASWTTARIDRGQLAVLMATSAAVRNVMRVNLHVVLVAPRIHWNAGNVGRTCLGLDATLVCACS